jgi:hypothetical protein
MQKTILLTLGIFLLQFNTSRSQTNFALAFDGTNDYLQAGSFTTPNYITVEAWVYIDNPTGNNQSIAAKWSDAAHMNFELGISGDMRTYFAVSPNGRSSYRLYSGAVLTTGRWYHVAGTYDGYNMKVLINGNPGGSQAVGGVLANTNYNLVIGASRNGNQSFWKGKIDDVRIWTIARTQSEIQGTMHKILAGNETNLISYYRMEEGSGNTISNGVVGKANAVLTNISNSTAGYNNTSGWIYSHAPLAKGSTGPGGVGGKGEVSDLDFWIQADNNGTTQAENGKISTWNDLTGNARNFKSGNNQPLYATANASQINQRGYAVFNGSQFADVLGYKLFTGNSSPLTIFSVSKPNSASGSASPMYILGMEAGNKCNNWFQLGYNAGGSSNKWGVHAGCGNATITSANYSSNWDIIETRINSSGSSPNNFSFVFSSQNNSVNANKTGNGFAAAGSYASVPSVLRLGNTPENGSSKGFTGYLAELFLFKASLNTVQRNLVHKYLGIRYNLPAANNIYGGGTVYSNDLVGIGRETDGTHAVANGGGLILNNISYLNDNGDYMVAAHNDGAAVTNIGLSGKATHRYTRVWYIDKTDAGSNNGLIELSFDLSDIMGGNLTASDASNYYLLSSAGGSQFTEMNVLSKEVVNSDQVHFVINASSLNDGYYTLGSGGLSSLPVALIEFSAAAQPSKDVLLKWTTAFEQNTDRFEVQHSPDGINFITAGIKTSKGNSNSKQYYDFVHSEIVAGNNYYRLKQVDKNNHYRYSTVLKVSFKGGQNGLQLKFNPVHDELMATYYTETTGPIYVSIVNSAGEVMLQTQMNAQKGFTQIRQQTGHLKPGTYILHTNQNGFKQQAVFIKQ